MVLQIPLLVQLCVIAFVVISEDHSKKVDIIAWHSITCHVPFRPTYDNLVIIWHVRTGKSFINLNGMHSDIVNNVSQNQHRSQIPISKDKKVREIDSRKKKLLLGRREYKKEPSRELFFLVDGNVFTTDFNPRSKWQLIFCNSKSIQELFNLPGMDTNNGCCCDSMILTQVFFYILRRKLWYLPT